MITASVSIKNAAGHDLRGILHSPLEAVARGVCILLLSPGIKGRVGPHRLYIKIAAHLVPLGFHVLRFDFHGLGDSEGELSEHVLADMYNSIQGGRYVSDTIAAMDWMAKAHGISRFVGSGLCGGSISALLTAEHDRRIECLLGIGLPTALEGGEENWARFLTKGQLNSLRRTYLARLTDVSSWKRFFSGRSSYQVIWKAFLQGIHSRQAQRAGNEAAPANTQADNTNPRFAPAFLSMLDSARHMQLFFSGADRLHHEFEEKFELKHSARLAKFKQLYTVHVIPEANHVLSDASWVRHFLDLTVPWLERRFPRR